MRESWKKGEGSGWVHLMLSQTDSMWETATRRRGLLWGSGSRQRLRAEEQGLAGKAEAAEGDRLREPHKCPLPQEGSGQLREDLGPWSVNTSRVTCSLYAKQLSPIREAVCPFIILGA